MRGLTPRHLVRGVSWLPQRAAVDGAIDHRSVDLGADQADVLELAVAHRAKLTDGNLLERATGDMRSTGGFAAAIDAAQPASLRL